MVICKEMVTAIQNALILGDAKEALPLLGRQYQKAVRCIYIDPPYNNGEVYRHYEDNTPDQLWLSEMRTILSLLKQLLREDGSLWMSIDDRNMHYLKVMADQVFGRENYVHTIVWQHRVTRENRNTFSNNHEYILVYARQSRLFKATRNKLAGSEAIRARYKNPDNDPRGPWQSVTAHVQDGHGVASQFYEIVAPDGRVHRLPKGRCWVYSKPKMEREIAAGNVWFGKDGGGVPRLKSFLKSESLLVTPETLWLADDVGTTEQAKKQLLRFQMRGDVFDTPKPEPLLRRILEIATHEKDVVLDCFLGSGTTAAVAHKMRRTFIGIERQPSAFEAAQTRLEQVVAGEQSGVSVGVGWSGGGDYVCMEVREGALRNVEHGMISIHSPEEEDLEVRAVKFEPKLFARDQLSWAEQTLLFEQSLTLYLDKPQVLHGTYRRNCRDWIVNNRLYNLRITKALAATAPTLHKVKQLLLTRKKDLPLFFKIASCRWSTRKELVKLGYPSHAKRSDETTYLLYSLVPCRPFVALGGKKCASVKRH